MNATETIKKNQSKEVEISSGKITVSQLTLRRTIQLFKILSDMKAELNPSANQENILLDLLAASGDKMGGALSLMTGHKIENADAENITLVELSAIVAAIVEVNDLKAVAANFQRATAALRVSPEPKI